MMDRMPLSARVFLGVSALLLAAGAILMVLGSFAGIAVASLGSFFLAQGLIARAVRPPLRRLGAVLITMGLFLYLWAGVMTLLVPVALALLAGGAIALILSRGRAG